MSCILGDVSYMCMNVVFSKNWLWVVHGWVWTVIKVNEHKMLRLKVYYISCIAVNAYCTEPTKWICVNIYMKVT